MCIICIDFDRRAMTSGEARRALGEMEAKIGPRHAEEVKAKLAQAQRDAAAASRAAAAPATPATPSTDDAATAPVDAPAS